ncbi:DUF3515 family protein [Streptomyces cyanogenus]|uniref:DUF3515 family protein n=1 Tax=Streptomyces cyanogenus TaxID=80860 RepID=A0ABX7TW52_STRCY|nr:DUF3515 family protein [Streptomyces cyanogenus]QTE00998.1 hypothetical protein S1361_26940 [Streptomyces cyanogenus]
MFSTRRNRIVLAIGVCVLGAIAAVTGQVLAHRDPGVPAAKDADAAPCRRITSSAPESLGGLSRWDTDAPGVAVWGDRHIVLRCGVTPPGPTEDMCVAVDGVDWVIDSRQTTESRKVVVTYGRVPATQVVFEGGGKTDAALIDLSRLVAPVRQRAHCIDAP